MRLPIDPNGIPNLHTRYCTRNSCIFNSEQILDNISHIIEENTQSKNKEKPRLNLILNRRNNMREKLNHYRAHLGYKKCP